MRSVQIVTPPRLGGPYYWAENLAHAVRKERYKAEHVKSRFCIAKSLLWQKSDVYHTTIPLFPLFRKRTVLTIHGDYTIEGGFWKNKYEKAESLANAITVPSLFLKRRLKLDATVIPNAINVEQFQPRARKQETGIIRCVTMASLYFKDKSEGVLKIMKMLNALHGEGIQVTYDVIGAGKYLPMLKEEASKLKLPVTFRGFVHNPGKMISNSDLFLYYSTHDNFPLALLEGMACALPVITNEVGAVREIFDDGRDGIIAENDKQYLSSLRRALDDPALRRRLGVNAREKVSSKFDWKNVGKDYVDVYDGAGK